jgi:uncharacterized delta-60 repeat protein
VTLTIRPRRLAITVTFIAVLLGSAILSAGAQAASGDLDPTFSGDGKLTTGFRAGGDSGNDVANGIAVQDDGKIVVVGGSGTRATGSDFTLARYNPDGTLDKSFSGDGRQRTGFGIYGPICVATAVAIQDDGKIVVVGFTHQTSYDYAFAIARYNPDGTLDTSFSGDGRQRTYFFGTDHATGVAIQGDGKIVVVGDAYNLTTDVADFAIARYNPNGTLDTSFSGDGRQTTAFGGYAGASAVALQGEGRIVAAGVDQEPPNYDFALARYNPNGTLDTSFSGDGTQTTSFGGGRDIAHGVAIQDDGKIVAAGQGGNSDFALARYNPDGSLDPSFSGDGRQTTGFGFGPHDAANGIAIQGDGRIVAAGHASVPVAKHGSRAASSDFALARYSPNGTLDKSFSGNGREITGFGRYSVASAVALQVDGNIVAAGKGRGTDGTSDFALARYLGG